MSPPRRKAPDKLWRGPRRIVVCGSGGVGKTTLAAALAVAAAVDWPLRVLVVTVDPARRLADALGAGGLGNDAAEVPDRVFSGADLDRLGQLSASMLDPGQCWDDLVRRTAPDEGAARALFDNPLYENLTQRFAGAVEYIAVERLYELSSEGTYDLVIVDTPPGKGGLDLLDAPGRMASFFGSRLFRWLTLPVRSRAVALAARPFTQLAERVLGTGFLDEIGQFFLALEALHDGFVTRSGALAELLRANDTRFVIVTRPEEPLMEQAQVLRSELARRDLGLGAVIVNRVLPGIYRDPLAVNAAASLVANARELAGGLARPLGGSERARIALLEEVGTTFAAYADAASAEAALLTSFDADTPVVAVEDQMGEIGDVAHLCAIGRQMLAAMTRDPEMGHR